MFHFHVYSYTGYFVCTWIRRTSRAKNKGLALKKKNLIIKDIKLLIDIPDVHLSGAQIKGVKIHLDTRLESTGIQKFRKVGNKANN